MTGGPRRWLFELALGARMSVAGGRAVNAVSSLNVHWPLIRA